MFLINVLEVLLRAIPSLSFSCRVFFVTSERSLGCAFNHSNLCLQAGPTSVTPNKKVHSYLTLC